MFNVAIVTCLIEHSISRLLGLLDALRDDTSLNCDRDSSKEVGARA